MKMRADVNQAGTIVLNASTPGGGWLKEYLFDSPESLYNKCKGHDWVERPDKKIVKGSNYSLQMARNDFKKFAK
jgi:hypothetical protein